MILSFNYIFYKILSIIIVISFWNLLNLKQICKTNNKTYKWSHILFFFLEILWYDEVFSYPKIMVKEIITMIYRNLLNMQISKNIYINLFMVCDIFTK